MFEFPIFLNLQTLACLVVGAGQVGRRKTGKLLQSGASSVCLLDPAPPGADELIFQEYAAFRRVCSDFSPACLEGAGLVFAATGNADLNEEIADLCAQRNILCNVASNPEQGRFVVPAAYEKAGFIWAVRNRANCPGLSRLLGLEFHEKLGMRHALAVELMQSLRPRIISSPLTQPLRSELLGRLAEFAFNPTPAAWDELISRAELPPLSGQEQALAARLIDLGAGQ